MAFDRSVLAEDATSFWVYVGTYSRDNDSEGIYVFPFDTQTGDVGEVKLAAISDNPSFLAVHPTGDFVFAANEVGDFGGENSGGITAFRVNRETGGLAAINQQPSRGAAPCHLVVDRDGQHVLVANYTGGSVAVLPITADGSLEPASAFIQHTGSSINARRQGEPHAHSINLDIAGRFAFAADLGCDKIFIYRYDATKGTLGANEPAFAKVTPGAGPRHFAFHTSGKFAYVINELDLTVTAFRYDAQAGRLTEIQTVSTLPPGTTGDGLSTAEVRVHPTGRFLYGSNRGHDTIAIFSIDQSTGMLQPVGHEATRGNTPRNFVIDPSGKFFFAENQRSGNVAIFRVDAETGQLEATGDVLRVPSPVCIRFVAQTR